MWEQIRSNRRRSVLLVFLIAMLLGALGYALGEAAMPQGGLPGVGIAAIIWIVMSLVAYFKGDDIMLAVSGAREIQKADEPRLFNVVEEMTIAAGLPKMPRVFIVDDMALNAFATGRSTDKSAVAVTAGLLGKLNRDELQGVIAHEMTHVVNRDVLFMTMVGVMLGTIVIISNVFLRSLAYSGRGSRRYRSSGQGGGQAQAIMFVVAIVLAILSPILAQLIYFAISRRREYLADAGACVLTRYPEGLASALEAIGGDALPLASANKATAPMYIANPFDKMGRAAFSLNSTHPPLEERIRVLRSMPGMVGYAEYNETWQKVHHSRGGVMPASTLVAGAAAAVPVRAAFAENAADADPRRRMREAGDLLRKMDNFAFLDCACGLKLKLPPDYAHDTVQCPRCKAVMPVQTAKAAAAPKA